MEVVLYTDDLASIGAIQRFLAQHPSIRATATFKAVQDNTYDVRAYRTPTANFKHFCGSEWIARSGMITAEAAVNRILQYATVNKLIMPDTGRIEWNDELLSAVGSPDGPVYTHTLLDVVKRILT